MSNSIADVLANKNFDEPPPEIVAIKQYVQTEYQQTVEILVRDRDIVITTASASLANTLRLQLTQLRQIAQTKKKISFRIR